MNIEIFEPVTTEVALLELEKESKKYEGLHVEMDDAEQRKYVKGKAQTIKDMLKNLKETGIKARKDYANEVSEKEAAIRERLENANKPFTLLIDDYNSERARILADEKAERERKELAIQFNLDHELALNLDELETLRAKDKAEREHKLQIEHDEQIKQQAILDEQARVKSIENAKAAEDSKRLNDRNHKAKIHNEIVDSFVTVGISADTAKELVRLIASGKAGNTYIKY